MRALVTGGAGFIGSRIATQLLAQGWEVCIIDNVSTGKLENVPPAAEWVEGDVRDRDRLAVCFKKGFDAVFHLAAQVSNILSYRDPTEDVTTNVVGTINLLELCRAHHVPRFMHASSMALYGQPAEDMVDESAPLNPLSFYGISKLAAENYVMAMARRNDLAGDFRATSLRMFNVFGPGQSLDNPYQGVISVFISNILKEEPITLYGSGRQSRDFVHIDDVIAAWMLALDAPATFGEALNVGHGRGISINDMLDAVLREFGHDRSSYRIDYQPELPGDQRRIVADISKARELIRWQPAAEFNKALRETIQWARQYHAHAAGNPRA